MPKIADYKPGDKIRALVYGESKAGKTFGAGSFPRPNYICFDPGGVATLTSKAFKDKYPNADISYELFQEKSRNAQGVVTAHAAFDDACRYFDACMKPSAKWTSVSTGKVEEVGRDQFDTWVIDSGTTLSEAAMNKAIVLLGGKGFALASQTHAQALNTGLVFPKIQDYGSERSMVEQFVAMVLDSDKHLVLLCHQKEVTNDEGRVTAITPLLTGKGVQAVCLKFDEIWNLRAVKSGPSLVRKLTTESDGIRIAGTRYGVPSDTEWNYNSILNVLKR